MNAPRGDGSVVAPLDATVSDFAERLRSSRVAAGVTQSQVARATGLTPKHISMLERGLSSPSRAAVLAIANALGDGRELRTALLVAAGFAPEHTVSPPRSSRGDLLAACLACNRHHPAMAFSTSGELLAANRLGVWIMETFMAADPSLCGASFAEPGVWEALRGRIENFEDVARRLARRVSHERAMRWRHEGAAEAMLDLLGQAPETARAEGSHDAHPWLDVVARVGELRLDITVLFTTVGEPPFVPEASVTVVWIVPMDAPTRARFASLGRSLQRKAEEVPVGGA